MWAMTHTTASAPPATRLAYTKAQLLEVLPVSPTTLWRWEKRNILKPIPGIRHKLYSVAAVRRIVEQGIPEAAVSAR